MTDRLSDEQLEQIIKNGASALDEKLPEKVHFIALELQQRRASDGWVEFDEKNPPREGRYAILYRYRDQPFLKAFTGDYLYNVGWASMLPDTRVTHYFELPEIPPLPQSPQEKV